MVTLTMKENAFYLTTDQFRDHDDSSAETQFIPEGDVVPYLGHVPGGMVKVRYAGDEVIINPHSTEELS